MNQKLRLIPAVAQDSPAGPALASGEPAPAAAAVADLNTCLAELQGFLRRLADLAGEKLAAVRRADSRALQDLALTEQELVKQVLSAERERAAVLARVAQGLPNASHRPPTLTDIAAQVPEPAGSALRARGLALRATATELQQKNRVLASVARNLQEHVRGIFAAWAKSTQEALGYGASGQPAASACRSWVDAVG